MKLDSVDIFGFKSFGERTELSFHEGVTAIVGPNGCGKSNISDAIGWALGEQSAKSLRGKRMEDLIFTGSDARPPVSVAEVNLKLSQVNGDLAAERRQVTVTRRLYRSGESEYLMDGRPCRLRDIHEVFMDTGVGTKAYAIIEQGKIGQILASKPSDRRALIEEAAGITKYKVRRRSAELKLQAAQQNLLRINDIVYEVERQMSSVKRQAGKARRYRRLRDAMSHLEKIAAVKRGREIDAELRRLRAKLLAVRDEELRRSTSLATAENYLERLRLEQAERETDLTQARDRLHQIEIAIERLDGQIDRDREQRSELEARSRQLTAELEDLEGRFGPASQQLELRENDRIALAEELGRSEEQARETQHELSQASTSLAEAEGQIEDKRAELVHRISKIAALHNFLQGVIANSEKVSAEILKLEEEVRELRAEVDRVEAQRHELSQELAERGRQNDALTTQAIELEAEAQAVGGKLAETESDMSHGREELSELNGRLASLEELVEARAHYGAGARHLLMSGPEFGIRFSGSVADSMEVEPRFERAAESFLGESLQRIVVATAEDALAAKARLEVEKVGRCDFLIESLADGTSNGRVRKAFESLSRKGVAGLIGVLSDAVRWTNGQSDWLSRSMSDAIVVEDADQAFRAYRLEPTIPYVTLAGEVLEPPGVLRVGPGGPSEGLLRTRREIRELLGSVSRRAEELKHLERQHRERGQILESLRKRITEIAEERHALEKDLVGLEHRTRQMEQEEDRARRKGEVLASERARSEAERAALSAKRVEMERSLAAEEDARNEVESRLDELRASLTERRARLEELQGRSADRASELARLRERAHAVELDVERLGEGVKELESRMVASRRERLDLAEKAKRLEDDLAQAQAGVQTSIAERETLIGRVSGLDGDTRRVREQIDSTEAALKLRRRELESAREVRASEEVALAREELEMSHLREGFERVHGMTLEDASAVLIPADIGRPDDELAAELADLKEKIDSIGPVNPMADEEYRELHSRHEFMTAQRKDLLDSIASTESAIRRIDVTSRQRFQEAFERINEHFDVTFKQLFGGGRAGLTLIDDEDLLESGVDIIAQPPGKRLQNVLLLSGGEKALTAIALMFSVFRYKPSPFCLLDEVDAPLDDANVGRFVSMLVDLRETTQFIIITHNRKTMEMADQMYGVTMEEPGVSKLVSVRLLEGEEIPERATV